MMEVLGCLLLAFLGGVPQDKKDEFAELCRKIGESRKELKFLSAEVRVERTGKYEDASTSAKGKLWWKPGAVIMEETDLEQGARPVKTFVREGEAVVLRARPKKAEIYELARYFFAAALLRDGVTENLRKDWDVVIAARPEQTKLPDELHAKDGEKPKPRDAKVPGGRPRAGSQGEGEEGKHVILELRPLREPLKEFVQVVRVHLNKDTWHVEKVSVDDAMALTVYRFSDWKPLDQVEERLFEPDLAGVPVERK
ncbi:MAG: hypothetical protein HYY17_00665 [Planctomycetes bacterium]|nr:hypothetical protein [Planctomycetota bacterium]